MNPTRRILAAPAPQSRAHSYGGERGHDQTITSRARELAPIFLLAALVLVFFAPAATMQGVYFFGDAGDYFARLAYASDRLRMGQLALWNPYLSLGGSHAADPAALPWYPIPLPLFLLLPSVTAYNYTVLLHVLLAGGGMFLLARAWGQTRAAALLAGIVYAFNGFALAHLQHLNILVGVAWVPLIFYFVERLLTTRRSIYLALASLALALQILGGHTQIVLYSTLALGAYVVVWLVTEWREARLTRRELWQQVSRLIAVFALALGLAAVYLVPLTELLNFVSRTERVSFDFATSFSLEPARLITLLFPFFFGGSFWRAESGPGSFIEMSAFVGVLTLALAAMALTRSSGWRVRFLAALGVIAVLLALGRFTPLYELVYRLPLLGSVRAPARFLMLFVFALAALAGFGLDALRTRPNGWLARMLAFALALLAIVTLVTGILLRMGLQLPKSFAALALDNPATWASVIAMFGAVVLLGLWMREAFSERVRLALTLVLVSAELFFFSTNLWYNRLAPPTVYSEPSAIAQRIRAEANRSRFYYWGRGEYKLSSALQQGDLDTYLEMSRDGLRQSLPMRFGLFASQGYGSEPEAFTGWVNGIEGDGDFNAESARIAGLFGVSYVLTQGTLNTPSLHFVSRAGRINLYRNLFSAPRIRVVSNTVVVADQRQALATIQGLGFTSSDVVLEAPAPPISTPGSATVALRRDEPEQVIIDVQTDAPAYLVLSDTFYPGWRATVDRQPAPIYRADALVRAVPIGAGSHTVEFVYDPPSVKIGAAISLVSLIIAFGILVMGARRVEPTV